MEDTDLTQQEPQVLAANMALPGPVANAAQRGDLRAVKAWLARPSSEIDAMDGSRWTLLHHTCLPSWLTAENVAVAEYLLSRGASVNIGDSTALHIAIARPTTSHSTDIIDLLLRALGLMLTPGKYIMSNLRSLGPSKSFEMMTSVTVS